MKDIIEKQKEFQKFVGFPIDSYQESDRNELSEIYLFKMIEEIVELRKEIPSVMNKWSKKNGTAEKSKVMNELSDVMLFLINFCIAWRLNPEEIIESLKKVQQNNFMKVKEKKMNLLNDEMLKLPGYTIGLGQGNLSPKYVFIGQNPGQSITHGYRVWSNPEDGSSKILLPLLEDKILDCYFTNIVKSTTIDNKQPSDELTKFWLDYLNQELLILLTANLGMKLIAMGNWTYNQIGSWRGIKAIKITHPSYFLRNGSGLEKYGQEIQSALAYSD